MNQEIQMSIEQFLRKANQNGLAGELISREEANILNNQLNCLIPDWYINLLTTYPISGIELAYQAFPPEQDYDGILWIEILNSKGIFEETNNFYPGIAIQSLGYFCIGGDAAGGGNPYFVSANQGDNPPVFQVYHDVSDDGAEIVKNGMRMVAQTLSQLFDIAILD